jgi:hypothetical protein
MKTVCVKNYCSNPHNLLTIFLPENQIWKGTTYQSFMKSYMVKQDCEIILIMCEYTWRLVQITEEYQNMLIYVHQSWHFHIHAWQCMGMIVQANSVSHEQSQHIHMIWKTSGVCLLRYVKYFWQYGRWRVRYKKVGNWKEKKEICPTAGRDMIKKKLCFLH